MDKHLDFKLRYSGDIVSGRSISIRTLGNTLPNFQRAIDKAVIFTETGEVRKNKGISRTKYDEADLMLELFEEGSVILPLWGNLTDNAVKFFKWSFTEPYNKAVFGDEGFSREHQVATYRTRQKENDLEEKTQGDLIVDSKKDKRKFARSAILGDLNSMFNVVRAPGDRVIDINIEKTGLQESFKVDKAIAKSFRKIVATPYPTEPVIYVGKYNGYKPMSEQDGGFEVYVKSRFSDSTVHVYVKRMEDLKLFSSLNHNDEVVFWGSPIQKYGAFDPYSGSVIFIGMYS